MQDIQMELLFIVLLVIHILVCIVLFFLVKSDYIEAPPQMLPIAVFVPIWGVITLLICNRMAKRGLAATRNAELDNMILQENDFRKITYEEERTAKGVVPLEEAIRINDTKIRRKLMMDIMRQDPGEFIRLLQQARLNDDIEVTHYASTAMMEVQRKFEIDIQRQEKELQAHPEDKEILDEYIKLLKKYIDSGMLKENMLIIQRVRYDNLLKKKITEYPNEKQPYFEAADNYIELGYFDDAEKMVGFLIRRWPNDEKSWILKLKMYYEWQDKTRFDETVSEIKRKKIYFSSQYKDLLSYWNAS
jgi:hypothetical protein